MLRKVKTQSLGVTDACTKARNPATLMLSRLSLGAPALRRVLSGASHVGVLHVYKLEAVDATPDGRPRLLFPTGTVESEEASAAALAEAAERGEPVLVPESALRKILASGGASTDPLQIGTDGEGPRALPAAADSPQRREEGGLVSTASELALTERARPLSQLLAQGGCSQPELTPDWRVTTARERSASDDATSPSDAQRAVLNCAADGDAPSLRDALAACPPDELSAARLAPSGASPLHLAASSGSAECVDALLAQGASVAATAANGSTPLHWAAGGGHAGAVSALLAAGACTRSRSSTWRSTVRGESSGQTAAHWAAGSGHSEALELLLSADPHCLLMHDERELAPAAVAARDGHIWLQHALEKLEREKVVCVRVHRETTMQRPLASAAGGGERGGDQISA